MIVPYLVYDPVSGRIHRVGMVANEAQALAQAGDGEAVLVGQIANDETDYVSGGELLPRPTLSGFDKLNITADDEDTASITLPEGTVVVFNGEVFTIEPDDLVLEITADVAGTYVVEVNPPWPWVAETYTIEATDPEP